MLKRYLRSRYKMSPDEYRAALEPAARLSDGGAELCPKRSDFAKKIGLGKGSERGGKRKKS